MNNFQCISLPSNLSLKHSPLMHTASLTPATLSSDIYLFPKLGGDPDQVLERIHEDILQVLHLTVPDMITAAKKHDIDT